MTSISIILLITLVIITIAYVLQVLTTLRWKKAAFSYQQALEISERNGDKAYQRAVWAEKHITELYNDME